MPKIEGETHNDEWISIDKCPETDNKRLDKKWVWQPLDSNSVLPWQVSHRALQKILLAGYRLSAYNLTILKG